MNLIRLLISRSRGTVAMAVLAGVASGASSAALIAIINALLRANLVSSSGTRIMFIALCVVRFVTGIFSQFLLIRLSQGAILELRMNLCRQILHTPLEKLEVMGEHRLAVAFGDDMLNIATVVINLPYMLVNVTIVLACLIYIGWLSAAMLAGITACLVLGILSYLFPVVIANRHLRSARREQDSLFGHFRAMNDGMKELKLHEQRRAAFVELLETSASNVAAQNIRGITIYSTAANWGRLLFFVYAGLLVFLFPSLLNWHNATAMAGFVLTLLYMMAPLEAIMNVLPHFGLADAAVRQIRSLGLELVRSSEDNDNQSQSINPSWKVLELRDVQYHYPPQEGSNAFQLGPISLRFHRGEITFIIGGNGAGKSTLAKVLTGLYEPASGDILLDGCAVTTNQREPYRQLFSAIYGDFHLFDELLGLECSDADARRWLARLGLDHKVSIESGRLSTTSLSAGQRKRMALLMAILEDRPVYVFDEWAADQDPAFKEIFYSELVPELKARGKSVLVITHDRNYLSIADRVLTCERGTIT